MPNARARRGRAFRPATCCLPPARSRRRSHDRQSVSSLPEVRQGGDRLRVEPDRQGAGTGDVHPRRRPGRRQGLQDGARAGVRGDAHGGRDRGVSGRNRTGHSLTGDVMDLIALVLVVALVGFIIWVITTYIPMPPHWATAIHVISLIVLLLFILSRFVAIPNVLR